MVFRACYPQLAFDAAETKTPCSLIRRMSCNENIPELVSKLPPQLFHLETKLGRKHSQHRRKLTYVAFSLTPDPKGLKYMLDGGSQPVILDAIATSAILWGLLWRQIMSTALTRFVRLTMEQSLSAGFFAAPGHFSRPAKMEQSTSFGGGRGPALGTFDVTDGGSIVAKNFTCTYIGIVIGANISSLNHKSLGTLKTRRVDRCSARKETLVTSNNWQLQGWDE